MQLQSIELDRFNQAEQIGSGLSPFRGAGKSKGFLFYS
jgi:hypothetical protein